MGIKIIHGVTVSKSLKLMKGLPAFLNDKGFEVIVITSDGQEVSEFAKTENCIVNTINIEREISIFQDIKALYNLILYIKKEKPTIINAGTPKAGLLMMLASWVTRVPIRIYTLRGLRLETTKGFKRVVLTKMEKLAMYCSTNIIAISESLKLSTLEMGLTNPKKIKVLGKGSSNGIDLNKFEPTAEEDSEIESIKEKLGIGSNDFILGYVGRLTKDKGIELLIEVFLELRKTSENVKLLLVGELEENDSLKPEVRKIIESHEDIIYMGYQKNPTVYYRIMDVFVFLSYREGFGNVSIEAAACKIPVLVQDVTGAKDTVLNNITGYIVKESVSDIYEKIQLLKNDPNLRRQLGENGRKWVQESFERKKVQNDISILYKELLQEL